MSANGTGHNRLSSLMWVQSAWTYTRHPDPNNAGQQGPSTTWVRDQDKIASGGYGEVFRERCVSPPGPVRAVKVISKASVPQYGTPLDYGRELAVIGLFSMEDYEPFFVQSHGWYDDPENVYISMEFIEHGSLQQHLTRPLREAEARSIVQQVLTGVEYMHQANYAHRDLKPANILVASPGPRWAVKIADFGLSKRVVDDETMFRTVLGTRGYQAPEILGLRTPEYDNDGNDEGFSYTHAVDIWSIGVILHVILTGRKPFDSKSHLARHVKGKVEFPLEKLRDENVSIPGQDFVRALLTADPERRPSAEACLQSAWMRSSQTNSTIQAPTQAASSSDSGGQISSWEDSVHRHRGSSNRCTDSQRTEVYRG